LDTPMILDEPGGDPRQRRARHYIGFVQDPMTLAERIGAHKAGTGAKFLAAANGYGIAWRLVSVRVGSRDDERKLKLVHNSIRYCPLCQIDPALNPRAVVEQRRRRLFASTAPSLRGDLTRLGLAHLYGTLKEYE
jgi:hypothetical protein